MIALTLKRPWMELALPAPMRVLSWTLNRPGFCMARRLVWREVRNADLPPGLDVEDWLARQLAARGGQDAPCFLTSCDIGDVQQAHATVEGVQADCVATVGLSNAERIGQRRPPRAGYGTINIAAVCDLPLSDAALMEALTIVAQARTAAVMEHGPDLPTGRATGTGTDCIAVATPPGPERFAGMHTPQAEALGRATYRAVSAGVRLWMEQHGTSG